MRMQHPAKLAVIIPTNTRMSSLLKLMIKTKEGIRIAVPTPMKINAQTLPGRRVLMDDEPYIPQDGSAYILVNYVTMPVSWVIFCASPSLFLNSGLSVRKRSLFIAITICSCILFVATTTFTVLLYVLVYNRIETQLIESIRQTMNDNIVFTAWNETQSAMQCCGVNGPADWTSAGYLVPPCGGFRLPCLTAIFISYFIIWGMSVLGQVAAVFVAAKGTFEFQFVEYASDKFRRMKSSMHYS
uniref:Uncharacterized protein LOC100178716 n=1 Tax=Phallusia mammillata TaxID=59560 RepID=A0A6F9DG72_9ASCI|nr:uncharacterized protein LOC100178716 [Phallusia mammillata]